MLSPEKNVLKGKDSQLCGLMISNGFACDVSAFAILYFQFQLFYVGVFWGILKDGILLFYIDE